MDVSGDVQAVAFEAREGRYSKRLMISSSRFRRGAETEVVEVDMNLCFADGVVLALSSLCSCG